MVSIVRCNGNVEDAVVKAVKLLGGMDRVVKPGEKVLLKPNLGHPKHYTTGATTNPEVTKALVKLCYEAGAKKVYVAESPSWGYDVKEVFQITEIESVREAGGELVSLDETPFQEVEIPGARYLRKVRVARLPFECDKVINIPVMKTHMQTTVSLSLKNLKGLLPGKEKVKLHMVRTDDPSMPGLDIAIAEYNTVVPCHFNVMDGTVGMEGPGPADGEPVNMGLILAGFNRVAVDAVTSAVMGFNPQEINHIRFASELGVGPLHLEELEVRGLRVEEVLRRFKPAPTVPEVGPNIKILKGKACSGCLGTLSTAVYRMAKASEISKVPELYILVGLDVKPPEGAERVLTIGNCAFKKGYPHVEGCPPTGWEIVKGIRQFIAEKKPSTYKSRVVDQDS
ncbi:MAG: hypothetical protein DRO52_01510 [Candidatus Hecatellales archaeon]|nr:MAG: hypothetical protein DRO52_01510 [Candidatus Hecatellales archaeon]